MDCLLCTPKTVKLWMPPRQSRGDSYWSLVITANALISAGSLRAARDRLDEAARLARTLNLDPGYYEWLGAAYLRLGDTARARRALANLVARMIPTRKDHSIVYRLLAARIAASERPAREVVALLGSLTGTSGDAPRKSLFGSAYLALGHPDSALAQFTSARQEWNWGHEGQEEWVRLPLQVAHAAELIGHSTLAQAAYSDFLTAWKRADSTLPELHLARANLGRLQVRVRR